MALFRDDNLEHRVTVLEAQIAELARQLGADLSTPWEQQPYPGDDEIRELVAQGRKVEAIKLLRARTGLPLVEARDYIERLADLR